MLIIYPAVVEEPSRDHPLYVGNFFSLPRMRWRARRQRQALIFALALAWRQVTRRQRGAPGLRTEKIFLTHLAKQAPDAKYILQRFFKIERTGFRLKRGTYSPTIIRPRKLSPALVEAIERLQTSITFDPGPAPTSPSLVRSHVRVRREVAHQVIKKLEASDHQNLIPPVRWLLDQSQSITFYYRPSGRLEARDTSVWPIRAIEQWPGWLRLALFGTVIDIDSAFNQFLVEHLSQKHGGKLDQLRLKYPDLIASVEDKSAFRARLINDVLKVPVTPQSTAIIKHVLMALANGSNASARLFVSNSTRCEAANIVRAEARWLSPVELAHAGERLRRIAKQFRQAKKELCIYFFNERPTAKNQRRIFAQYFNWERKARYQLWQAVGQSGLHLHDGLDGVITDEEAEALVQRIFIECNIKVTVKRAGEEQVELPPAALVASGVKQRGELKAPLLSLESV